jgi:hypothetical protein
MGFGFYGLRSGHQHVTKCSRYVLLQMGEDPTHFERPSSLASRKGYRVLFLARLPGARLGS